MLLQDNVPSLLLKGLQCMCSLSTWGWGGGAAQQQLAACRRATR